MGRVDRRDFMRATCALALTAPLAGCVAGERVARVGAFEEETTVLESGIGTLPNFCSHEHWGSIAAIGTTSEGYRADTEAGATPSRPVSVWDLVLDPYLSGNLGAQGIDVNALARASGVADAFTWWRERPGEAFAALRPVLEPQRFTGTFQCTRRGVHRLYGVDLGTFALDDWRRADESVAARYSDIFGWYRAAMKEARFSGLIRPVHPEFYVRAQDAAMARDERAFTHTAMRIDPLLTLWAKACPRRDGLAAITGVYPADAASWRAFVARLFDLAAEGGALGIKQLQGYSRPLHFEARSDADVTWSGDLSREQVLVFQDWVMHECCKQAHDRGWPHQIHVGTHNLSQSSPLSLADLAHRYPRMNLVLLHCWPFQKEAGWLAKHVAGIYLDTCWQPVLNPAFLRESLDSWLNYVPTNKILMAHDSTSIEMAVGSSLYTRETLDAAITACGASEAAADLLHNNAVRVYGVGEKV